MNEVEARKLAAREIAALRKQPYAQLCSLVGSKNTRTLEIVGESGTRYQLEIQAFWDDTARKNLRVTIAIDDGGWRAFKPLLEDFIIAPDGTFVGE